MPLRGIYAAWLHVQSFSDREVWRVPSTADVATATQGTTNTKGLETSSSEASRGASCGLGHSMPPVQRQQNGGEHAAERRPDGLSPQGPSSVLPLSVRAVKPLPPRRNAELLHVGTRRGQHKNAERKLARQWPKRP